MSTINLVLRLAIVSLHILTHFQVVDAFIAPTFVSKSPRTSSLVRADPEFFDDFADTFADAFVEEDFADTYLHLNRENYSKYN